MPRFSRGERGPKGDHGQHGERGREGPPGEVVVVHDEARERKRDRRALYRAAQLIAVPTSIILSAMVIGLFAVLKHEINARVEEREVTTFAICKEAQVNRAALRRAVQAGDPTKLKPGDYGYAYARDHPEEAQQAHELIVAGRVPALRELPPIKCVPPGGTPAKTTKETP